MTAKKKKIIIRTTALTLALLLIIGVLWFANSLIGNPLSHLLAMSAAKNYVEELYPDSDFEVDYRGYDFKIGGYYAYASSPTKIDEHFGIWINAWGKVVRDGYSSVTTKWNVASRLGYEYRARVEALFEHPTFPYSHEIAYGDLEFDRASEEPLYPEALTRADLENNRIYDIAALGATNGEVVLYVNDTTLTPERAAEILLSVRQVFDTAGLPFHHIDLVIRPVYDGEGIRPDGIRIEAFLYSDIREEELLDRVKANIAAQEDA